MFGSNFAANFGIPEFPMQGIDPQGGYFGTNAPGQNPGQNAASAPGQPATNSVVPPAATSPPQPPIAAPSPLGGGPLSLGGGQTLQQPNANPEPSQAPPAAGIGSPFGKPGV